MLSSTWTQQEPTSLNFGVADNALADDLNRQEPLSRVDVVPVAAAAAVAVVV